MTWSQVPIMKDGKLRRSTFGDGLLFALMSFYSNEILGDDSKVTIYGIHPRFRLHVLRLRLVSVIQRPVSWASRLAAVLSDDVHSSLTPKSSSWKRETAVYDNVCTSHET